MDGSIGSNRSRVHHEDAGSPSPVCAEREHILVIGHWQLDWYEFDPHGGVSAATRDEWARPILTDEGFHFVSRDLSYGTHHDWRGKITIFGRELFAALEQDPPREFVRVCRPIPRPDSSGSG